MDTTCKFKISPYQHAAFICTLSPLTFACISVLFQAKRARETKAASKQLPQTAETEPSGTSQATTAPVQEGNGDIGKTNKPRCNKEGRVQWGSRKQHASSPRVPPEGSNTKPQAQME